LAVSLFDLPGQPIILLDEGGAAISLTRGWLRSQEADACLERLAGEVRCSPGQIQIFGRQVAVPRLQAWHGDAGTNYGYSGMPLKLQPWTPVLQELRHRLAQTCGGPGFNSVLVNLYRDGDDCVGWHADDESELGPEPCIASLSLGAERRFSFKPKPGHPGERQTIQLGHGDLLVMRGKTQAHYQHCAPRQARVNEPRWNLTFRYVKPRG